MDTKNKIAVEAFLDSQNISVRTASLGQVGELAEAFSIFPYENISKILKTSQGASPETWRRLPAEIFEDYQNFGLGGTCFSLTYYLLQIMHSVGLHAKPVMADMPSGADRHSALLLDYHGATYLVDPGYLIFEPVKLSEKECTIQTPSGQLILRRNRQEQTYALLSIEKAKEKLRYTLKPKVVGLDAFLKRWDDSFFWPGMSQLLITKNTERARLYLHNHHLRIIETDSIRKANIRKELESSIQSHFGIDEGKVRLARALLNERRAKKKI